MTRAVANNSKLLYVELDYDAKPPSSTAFRNSMPHLESMGFSINILTNKHPPFRKNKNIVYMPSCPISAPLISHLWFILLADLYYIPNWLKNYNKDYTCLIISARALTTKATLYQIHFVNCIWAKLFTPHILSERLLWLLTYILGKLELWLWKRTTGRLLPVSSGTAERLKSLGINQNKISILPNYVDQQRFNPSIRDRFRWPQRKKLGYLKTDFVLSYLSQGHYTRKGLFNLVHAVSKLRREGFNQVRLQIIGGRAKRIDKITKKLSEQYSDYEDWIYFSGFQDHPEKHLSCSDCFVFPSHYETFCLAAAEASALGIPLAITRYDGSEMYLKEGRNGIIISTEPLAMKQQIKELISGQSSLGEWDTEKGFLNYRITESKFNAEGYAQILSKVCKNHNLASP